MNTSSIPDSHSLPESRPFVSMALLSVVMTVFSVALLCSCSGSDGGGTIASGGLEITAEIPGFRLSDGSTFSVWDGHDDQDGSDELDGGTGITAGLYAVKDGGIVGDCANLAVAIRPGGMDAEGEGGLSVCVIEEEVELPQDAVFYLYAPRVEDLRLTPDAKAGDAEGFFAELVGSWTVPEDQSDEGVMAAAGLMTASASIADGKLHFAMRHAMSLLELELPGVRYVFTNTDRDIPDYSIAYGGGFSDGPVPLSLGTDRAVLLFNPVSGGLPSGRYGEYSWSCAESALPGESYLVRIGGGMEQRSHELRPGDFFLADGCLLSRDADAGEVASSDVVGIVFQTDPERIGAGEKEALGGTAHALVVSCRTVGDGALFQWFVKDGSSSRDETEIGLDNKFDGEDAYASFSMADADIEGYRNNMAVRTARAEDYAAGCYPAFKAAEDYGSEEYGRLTASGTTGWFLPSNGQWFDIVRNLCGVTLDASNMVDWGMGDFYWTGLGDLSGMMDAAMAKVPDSRKSSYYIYSYQWTSSPASETGARYFDFYYDGTAFCNNLSKSHADPVRCVLAF